MSAVYRVQDAEGRGPWRPGFSRRWLDVDGPPLPLAFADEFGWLWASIPHRFFPGEHPGCACRTLEHLARWISPLEARRLERFGYVIVRLTPDRVLAESENQVVFAQATPLRSSGVVVPWSVLGPSHADRARGADDAEAAKR